MDKDLSTNENESINSLNKTSKNEQAVAPRRSLRRSFIQPTNPNPIESSNRSNNSKNLNNQEDNLIKNPTQEFDETKNTTENKKQNNNKNRKNSQETEKKNVEIEKKAPDSSITKKQRSSNKKNEELQKPNWKEGDIIEAKDESDNWYKSRIIAIDNDEKQVKVHFFGWNSRYDQWFDFDSRSLRPYVCNDPNEQHNDNQLVSNESNENDLQFEIGSQVLAKWNDESFYPAIVSRHLIKNGISYYQVKFYDGVKKSVRFNNMRMLTEDDAKFFNIEYKLKNTDSLEEVANDESTSENKKEYQENLKPKDELEDRHAEAQLLLAIQEPVLNNTKLNEKPTEDITFTNNETTKSDIENQQNSTSNLKDDVINDKDNLMKVEVTDQLDKSEFDDQQYNSNEKIQIDPSARKSLRVKRLRTFTKEIVFDSPTSSITYNLASVSNPAKLVTDHPTISQPKRRKVTSTSTADEVSSVKAADDSNLDDSVFESSNLPTTSKKAGDEGTKLIQNYFKSLKIFKSNKKQTLLNTPAKSTTSTINSTIPDPPLTTISTDSLLGNVSKSKSGRISISSKRKQEYEEEKAEELRLKEEKKKLKIVQKQQRELLKQQLKKQPTSRELKKLNKKMEKKKLKKDKKKLLKKLIESSQQQLKQQQELIEKQLKKHEHKKSQKKLQKFLKQQQLQLQLQIQQQIQFQQQQIQQNIFFPTAAQPKIFNNMLLNQTLHTSQLIKTQQQNLLPANIQHSSNEPIKCHFEGCNKSFRKQSLLDYHLKYHHYALQTPTQVSPVSPIVAATNTALPKRTTTKRTSRQASEDSNDYYDGDDPYEVIHCKCGNNISIGFMIQCEICLCWQHGDCMNIKSAKTAPKNYLCWICKVPSNKLRQLKYQSWMSEPKNKDLCISESHFKLDNSSKNNIDLDKLRLLNECSKKYSNLNLLMYTLEYQMSMLTQLGKQNESLLGLDLDQINDLNNLESLDDETIEQIEKLLHNISHLQDSLSRRFNEFNSKIDEYESKYKCDDDNLISRNFNLEELYGQLQSIMGKND